MTRAEFWREYGTLFVGLSIPAFILLVAFLAPHPPPRPALPPCCPCACPGSP